MKILIIRFSSIGDIVLTTPVIRCLKSTYPDSEIHFLVKKNFYATVQFNPYIDKIHLYEEELANEYHHLKNEQFDYIIDLQKNMRSQRIKMALKCTSYTFPKLNVEKWIYVNLKWNLLPEISIVDRYFKAVAPLKVSNDDKGLDFFIPDHLKTKQEDIPLGHIQGYVACVIGGSFNTKKFPVQQWKAFCKTCPFPMILLGGPEDAEMAKEIETIHSAKIYNAVGKFSLLESADLVARSKVVVTNDTGLMHIAAAFQKPIISLWGNTVPELGMFPYYGQGSQLENKSFKSINIEIESLSCRPCSKIGFDQCPKGHFRCMNDISVVEVAKCVERLWK